MKRIIYLLTMLLVIAGCNSNSTNSATPAAANAALGGMLNTYFNERMELFPVEATVNGDQRFNNLLPADFTDSYRSKLNHFFSRYKDSISRFDPATLNDNDKKSYAIFKYEMDMALEGLALNFMGSSAIADNRYMPFDQFNGVPISFGQMGSGSGNQPFKTVNDYDNWLQRAAAFSAWADSAIVYFKKGMAINYVLPKAVVIKMIPQMKDMVTADATKSLFYAPVQLIPATFPEGDKKRLTAAYIAMINNIIVPAYKKLGDFLQMEYLPKARTSTGINALPGGDTLYRYLVKYWTTTSKTPDAIYQTGLSEVKRIRTEMETIKNEVGFKGSLDSFFTFMKTDKQFMPYKTADEVLNAFRKIQATIDPNLKKMFTLTPKTKFEIRQTEAFRAASASAEYYPGLPDGSRPGIFYVPIVDATKFNTTSGMESLFLHEAIPGHHYQTSIQSENQSLLAFRRFIWYGAYGEGYALYCESLGKELGLYTDPYQHMGALGDEIHRAIRLVVDVAMHTGKMTREEAIQYMMQNEAISEDGAVAEIERYMVYPAQALSYKTGALKIRELRNKYSQQLGDKFSLAAFHDEFLKDGCMPLDIIERSMDEWAKKQAAK
ncbi:DUF885 domain-containing protein [Ferruginibacter paludis]|uniref:DUF885 domain-containing protein n=1 Tax=Ferruginibacter paludis TaxID=1310417 RepID=UPI0025B2E2ED|nr:DUF885 domain-containing protein [Ferruginibacter paludis]MDN3657885.1 DUF885 domain-containing protein [Ferruginibacter paludis]